MTVIRLSAEDGAGRLHDLIVDAGDDATVADLSSALSSLGYGNLSIGGQGSIDGAGAIATEMRLDDSGIRHGIVLSSGSSSRWSPSAGWYLVAIAGPDTGAWIEITAQPSEVGRSSADALQVNDRSMSAGHFTVAVLDGEVIVEDLGSTNGTTVEGVLLEGSRRLPNGGYLHAGSTTFAVFHLDAADIPSPVRSTGPTQPFQRRFRSALEQLPRAVQHPNPPRERSEAGRRPLIAFAVPIISAVGMALVTGRYIFLLIIALGPVFYAVDGYRRRKIQDREDADEQQRYETDVEALRARVLAVRSEDVRRDRWSAAPAGLAALLVEAGHQRLWERSPTDDDFCEVAIGLHDRASGIVVEDAPADGPPMPLDHYWAAVLRHSLVADGSLTIRGPLDRARAIGRSLVLDLASSQSPHDLKVWLLTDGDTSDAWNGIRWLPHNYLESGRSRIFTSPRARAAALQTLRAVVTERRRADREGLVLPVHLVVVDCLPSIATADITDLLVEGAGVGVFGVIMDEAIVPEGTVALLTMGGFADEARFRVELATQNFENQLPPQIAANAGLRICFRVQDPAHSKVVLQGLPDAADIPAERVGRAILRCHGGRPVEFQGARIAGPRPGRGATGAAVTVRSAEFSSLSEAAVVDGSSDVVAEDTDLYAVAEVLIEAAARTGWTQPSVPWPGEIDPTLTVPDVVDLAPDDMAWPVGVADEPYRQRQPSFGLSAYGPSVLLIGGNGARLDQVVRAIAVSSALRRGPHQAQAYVIDLLGQGLGALRSLPHVGGAAERNEPLAMRIVRHLAGEVASRKSRMGGLGISDVSELAEPWRHGFPDLVLYVHGGDRLILAGESDTSPLMAPVLGLLSESVGTGVRLVISGPPQIAHHRLGSSVGDRLVFRCSDRHEYGALDVSREFVAALGPAGRAVDVATQRLIQIGLLPMREGVTSSEVVRAVGQRLEEKWAAAQPRLEASQLPAPLFDLPWPIPIDSVRSTRPTVGVEQPVLFAIDVDSNQLVWLDAEEDGPIFTVAGGPRSGRSSALMTAATLMADLGWQVFSMPLSKRSPMASDGFVGKQVSLEDLPTLSELEGPVALFVDDANKCPDDAFDPAAFCERAGEGSGGPRAVFLSGPPDFFSMRSSLTRYPKRTALVLAPRRSQDATAVGFSGRLGDDVLRDQRPGTGVLLAAGEIRQVRMPNP